MIDKIVLLLLLLVPISLAPIYAATPNHSIHFDDSDVENFILKGTNTITNQENPSYQLNGFDDYLILESNLPEKLNEFSISVWVKPDFKIGAPATLSIVSESNAFDLSINNNKVDKNVAVFSVNDGIKWHQVQSKSAISESWTHLSATYSDNQIKIFVNGIQENSQTIDGDYSLTHQYGTSTQNSYDYILSKSNVIVGAFNPSIRSDGMIKNNFSGQIDDIMLYNTILLQDQISTLYQNDRVSYKPIIQNIEQPVSNIIGVANIYGFVTDPNHPNDQRIEAVSSEGYKIKKSSLGNNLSIISETFSDSSNVSLTNEITKIDNHTEILDEKKQSVTEILDEKKQSVTEILDEEKQSVTEISTSNVDSGNQVQICHFPITLFTSLVDHHLSHGDVLGECVR